MSDHTPGANAPIAWVTGAGTGIGKAVALGLAQKGYTVVASGRREELLTQTQSAAGDYAASIIPMPCDVADETEVRSAVERIQAGHGPIDVLVNSAGTTIFRSFMETTLDDFDRITIVNLRGSYLTSQAVLPAMLERGSGTIVMINSQAAETVFPDSSAYAASKAGLKAMADCMRVELRKKGIRVLSAFPGATATEIWPERVLAKYEEKMMKPEEVGEAIVHAITMPQSVMVEDLYMQPIGGPL